MSTTYLMDWDESGKRLYETGVDHGVLYPTRNTTSATKDKIAFTGGVVWNGLTSVTDSPSGAEANDIYADNIIYASLRSAEKFGGTIEAYMYPDEFSACNGEATPSYTSDNTPTPVAGVYVGQQARQTFGFCYRSDVGDNEDASVDPDNEYKLHLWWNCTAAPSERQYQTINESPEAITMSWEISTTPVKVNGMRPTASMVIDSTKADSEKLAALMSVLYGRAASGEGQSAVKAINPCLPTPDGVIAILATGDVSDYEITATP